MITPRPPSQGVADLLVGSPSVSNNSPAAGATFTLSAVVQNVGGDAVATTLRYYRSTDATITTSDTEVGTESLAGLAASGSISGSVDLTAPSSPGTYYYGACVDAVTDESDTANNCSASVKVDVEEPKYPDLQVGTPTVSDAIPEAGGSFALSATVNNDGDAEAPATTLRWYRSTDATITTSDTEVGTDAVGALAAGGTSSASVDLTAPSASGTYYYGACVDAVTDESDTTDNCSASVKVDVEAPAQPDLEVGTPTVNDATPEMGASFTLSATVRNAGDAEAPATTLRYYRSTDATITTSDTAVGTDAVGVLAASGTSAQSIDLTAPSTAGAYYYGACVDAVTDESDTTDNCSGSVAVTVPVPGRPELVVEAPSVSNSAPGAGTGFSLSVLVRNNGDAESPATTLRYYRSTDSTITTSDTPVGTAAVAGLTASGSRSESVDLTAPSASGTYYYGACVDAVTDESDTTNNCSASVKVDVEAPKYPDLQVGTPTVNDATPEMGASFTLSATVRNAGDAGSPATTLRYYRSTDATITTSDTPVGTAAVAGLTASGSRSESVDLTAPSASGTYYYGACVDAVTDESDTTNNCSGSVAVTVPVPGRPDLAVGSPSVSNHAPEIGAEFDLSATVLNLGDGDAAATTLRFYRSADTTITTADTSVGTKAVAELAASGSRSETIAVTAPSNPGPYYYGACVVAVAEESDTSNNCSASVEVTVLETALQLTGEPDLRVGTPTVDDATPETGAGFTLSATVSNTGDGASPATMLRYYRSTDATITRSDTAVGTDAVGVLAASGTSAQSIDLTAPSTAGAYYYGACADSVADESDTTDNCSASVKVDVEAPAQPDLEVGTPTVDDATPETGAGFTLSATVSNTGDGASPATTLRYYRSTDATITRSDTAVGTDAVGVLAASGTSAQSIDLTAPSTAGAYYYGACADSVADESDTTDNCSASVKVDVEAPAQPDLEVGTPTVDDATPETGASFTLSATVSNTGDGASPATTLRYYRSTDATITRSDTAVGTDAVGVLAASGTSAQSIDLTAPSTAGAYYYGACVDAVTDESDTTDNCSASVKVDVEAPAQPDLEVGTPTVNDATPETGASFTLSATVSNAGDGASPATTLRYYRSTDATITRSDTAVGSDAVGVLAASGTSAQSIDLTAPSTAGAYYYGACVDAVTDESDTTDNCSASVKVNVEAPAQPDLEVGTPTVNDATPEMGASFTLSATVRNAGDAEAPATTLRYYRSTDATITTSDTAVGTDAVGVLAASGTSAQSIDLAAPSTAGAYYYGACVDAVTDESDTTDNCSASVKVDVEEPRYPDLEVETPTVSDATPEMGAGFTLSATVSNAGDAESPATTLRYYRSTDSTITTSDTVVGSDAVGVLAASGTSAQSIDLTAPSTAGAYYYGACVDAVTDESDTANNCSASVKVDVEEPRYPDLEVETPTVSDASPQTGASFTLSATVSNAGDGASPATTLRYYRSTDATITTSDTAVGTDAVGVLAASGTSAQSIDLTAPSTAGAYYYGACVDAVTDESDTTDNCSASVKVDVTETQSSVEVTATEKWAPVGSTQTLKAKVLDENGVEDEDATVMWSSSDPSVATVDSNGVVRGVSEGKTTITATEQGSQRSTSTEFDVVKPVARIDFSPSSLSFSAVGEWETVTATLYDSNDNEMSPTYWGWRSADTEVAEVYSQLGTGVSANVQSIGEGSTTVSLSANGTTQSMTVTVTLPTARVDIDPASLTFEALGDTKSVTVKVLDGDGNEDEAATWSYFSFASPCCGPDVDSTDPEVYSIERTDDGLDITAEGPGSGQITISSTGVEPAILGVTVYMKPTTLEVSPSSPNLAVNGSTTLTATVKDANGNSIHVNQGDGRGGLVVYWATSDSAVATVEGSDADASNNVGATATVTGIAAGSTTITGRWGSSVTGTATVTVTP